MKRGAEQKSNISFLFFPFFYRWTKKHALLKRSANCNGEENGDEPPTKKQRRTLQDQVQDTSEPAPTSVQAAAASAAQERSASPMVGNPIAPPKPASQGPAAPMRPIVNSSDNEEDEAGLSVVEKRPPSTRYNTVAYRYPSCDMTPSPDTNSHIQQPFPFLHPFLLLHAHALGQSLTYAPAGPPKKKTNKRRTKAELQAGL